jgi:Protein of unknown function (DUF1302)
MTRHAFTLRGIACLIGLLPIGFACVAHGAPLDEQGNINLGVRAYTSARIGTENTDSVIKTDRSGTFQTFRQLTFPVSPAGHLRQSRFFVEAELDHDLRSLVNEGFGPFALLNDLPFKFRKFKYHLTYRGEYEGVYDYGPSEYRTAEQYDNRQLVPCFAGVCPDTSKFRHRLRDVATVRNRLFQAYLEAQAGDFLFRLGRQILAWGETDAFRLLDNINPIDNSFGGFLISLDERRVPLDMLVGNYYFGDVGPIYESYFEFFLALDDSDGFDPGIPEGSPWSLPNLGDPSATLVTVRKRPPRNFTNARGGFQFKFNAPMGSFGDGTFGLAHYYTYFDTPAVQTFTSTTFPSLITQGKGAGYLALAVQSAPLVQVDGATATFALPESWSRPVYLSSPPIVRMEAAYFTGEPRFRQEQIDPFIYASNGCNPSNPFAKVENGLCTGGHYTGDSINFVIGFDLNEWIRALNPNQTFFISTQFFYKHLRHGDERGAIFNRKECTSAKQPGCVVRGYTGEVLPVPEFDRASPDFNGAGAVQSILVHNPIDQYLQTLLISTSYYSGQINPSLTLFYDWSGAIVALPQVTFSRDPFRFTISYSYLYASRLKGASGVSLLRDRDNLLFQFEYVI